MWLPFHWYLFLFHFLFLFVSFTLHFKPFTLPLSSLITSTFPQQFHISRFLLLQIVYIIIIDIPFYHRIYYNSGQIIIIFISYIIISCHISFTFRIILGQSLQKIQWVFIKQNIWHYINRVRLH